MNGTLSEVHNNLLKQISQRNGFKDCTIEEYSTSAKGDNYVGQIIFIRLKEGEKVLEVILKRAPLEENFRKLARVRDIFINEIYLYDTVLPTFVSFQKEMGLKNIFDSYAKLYGKCDEEMKECLVLEDLTKNGYRHWNRKIPMNADHIGFVMAEYGKLHAVSFAMKKINPELFVKLSEGLSKEDELSEKKSYDDFLKTSCLHLEKVIKGNSILENAYKRVSLNLDKYFFEEILGSKEHLVITHGDCWCNNMLFSYENSEDAEKPTRVCLIDWQMSKCVSPLQDITYFFYASSSKEILYDYKKYLKIYHDSLSENLRQMSCDPEELFPFEELETWWKKYGRYGLLLGSLIFNVLYVESENVPQTENMTSIEDFFKHFAGRGHDVKVLERIIDLFNFLVDNEFV